MKITKTFQALLTGATILVSANWATATVSLQFTQPTITGAPGQDVNISLQLVTTSEGVNALDYWLTQTAGPTSNAFSLVGTTTRGASDFPNPSASDATVTSTGDSFNNSTGAPGADGIADNLIGPRNGPDLGATKNTPGTNFGAGTYNVGTFNIQIAANATPGTYTINTFDYNGFGWSGVSNPDNAFASEGSININVVPEPSTWSLFGLGGLGTFALGFLRTRRRVG